jgi:hypothetical protein
MTFLRRGRALMAVAGVSASLVMSAPASADVYCQGLVLEALSYHNGDVMILPDWRGD